jgi:hypothetical protein
MAIAIAKTIRVGIVEVDGDLHEAQAEHARVKVDILLWVARNRGDVMNTGN